MTGPVLNRDVEPAPRIGEANHVRNRLERALKEGGKPRSFANGYGCHAATARLDSAPSSASTSSMIARAVAAIRSRLARSPFPSPCHKAM